MPLFSAAEIMLWVLGKQLCCWDKKCNNASSLSPAIVLPVIFKEVETEKD